jgi:hypothetical protein
VPGRAEGICLDYVGTGFYIFFMNFANEVGSDQVELVIAAVDVDTFVVKPCPDGAVEHIYIV